MAKNQKKAAPVEKVKKAKSTTKLSKEERLSALYKTEALADLQKLRKAGVIDRRQFRLLAWQKGLGGVKGVPMYNSFEIESKGDKKVPVQKFKQWTRI